MTDQDLLVSAAPDAAREPEQAHYRYPGAPPFADTDLDRRLFRGRGVEIDTVLHSILSNNLFLVYGQSGLGKTSLLNAGVMQELRERGHWPVSLRLNDTRVSPAVAIREQLVGEGVTDSAVDIVLGSDASDEDPTLWDLLGSLEVWRGNDLQRPVLVLDQFEELFTLDWDPAVRERFIREFGEVVRGHRSGGNGETPPPDVRFVLVIREDAVGLLEELSVDVPQIMRHRFRLGPLDPERAETAIREPGLLDDERLDSRRFEYTEEAAGAILSFLRTSSVRGVTKLADGVDPSQLQIVCQYVERAIVARKSEGLDPEAVVRIEAADLGGRAGLDRILSDFYRRAVETMPASEQKRVCNLCERGLINPQERRLSLEQESIEGDFGVGRSTLQALVDTRLLRSEPRVGSVYYELAHDTLVPAILADREMRLAARRRRQYWAIGGVAALFCLLAVGLGLASLRDSTPGAESLDFDEGKSGELSSTESRRFELADAAEDSLIVLRVDPDPNLDVGVQATNSAGTVWESDVRPLDETEILVFPADGATAEVVVSASGSSGGAFEITAESATPEDVELGSARSGDLNSPIDVDAFRLEVGADSVVVVEVGGLVEPTSPGGDEPFVPSITVLPEDVADLAEPFVVGPGSSSDRAVIGSAGTYTVAVRGMDGTFGAYSIWAGVAPPLATATPADGILDGPDDRLYFVLDNADASATVGTPGDRSVVARSMDPYFDVDRIGPAGQVERLNRATGAGLGDQWFLDVGPEAGLLRLSPDLDPDNEPGFVADRIEVGMELSWPRQSIAPGTSLAVPVGPSVFDVNVDDGEILELTGNGPADDQASVQVLSLSGESQRPIDAMTSSERSLVFDQPGRYAVLVVASVESETELLELAPISVGDDPRPFSGTRPFYVEVTDGIPLRFVVRSDDGSDQAVGVVVEDLASEKPEDPSSDYGAPLNVDLGCTKRDLETGAQQRGRWVTHLVRLTVSTDGVADPPFTVELLEGLDECTADTETPDGLVTQALYALLVEAGAGQEGARCTIESWLNSAGGEERPEDAVLLGFVTIDVNDSEAIDELVLPIERAGRSEPCNLDDRTAREARKLFGQLIARR